MKNIILRLKEAYKPSWWHAVSAMLLIVFALIYQFHSWYYHTHCYTGEGIHMSPCYGNFLTYVYDPLTEIAKTMIIFSVILFFLPNKILRGWFLYIGSWLIPFAVYDTLTTDVVTGSFIPSNPAASASFWAYVLLRSVFVVVIIYAGIWIYRRYTTKRRP